jgi:hypothetical protein
LLQSELIGVYGFLGFNIFLFWSSRRRAYYKEFLLIKDKRRLQEERYCSDVLQCTDYNISASVPSTLRYTGTGILQLIQHSPWSQVHISFSFIFGFIWIKCAMNHAAIFFFSLSSRIVAYHYIVMKASFPLLLLLLICMQGCHGINEGWH